MRGNTSFQCMCLPGYSGIRCEIRDACQSNPCMNDGTCELINGNIGYQCICPSGFSGPQCETSMLCCIYSCTLLEICDSTCITVCLTFLQEIRVLRIHV